MQERNLIVAAIQSKEAYLIASDYDIEDSLTVQGRIVWKEITEFYSKDKEAYHCDREVLSARLTRKHPKHVEVLQDLISDEIDFSIPNFLDELYAVKSESLADRLLMALTSGNTEEAGILSKEYYDLYENGLSLVTEDVDIINNKSIQDIFASTEGDNQFKLGLPALDSRLDGGLNKGHHVLLFAVPEIGKSAFAIHFASSFLEQGKKVLYIGNEDPEDQMLMRFITRLSGMVKYEVKENLDLAWHMADEAGYGNLFFAALHPGSLKEIRALLKHVQPDVLIVDQTSELISSADSRTNRLHANISGMRNLSKEFNVLGMSVVQASDSATNKLKLERNDVHFSNIDIAAQVDLMLGIGCNSEYEQSNQRLLTLCKNKITGNHDSIICSIDPQRSVIS